MALSEGHRGVTILIPCHRTGTLNTCVERILGQAYPVDSVVIIADGVRVDDFPDERIRVLSHDVRQGKAASLNEAVTEVNTELVLMLDCDTYLAGDALGRMVDCLHGEIQVVMPHLRPSRLTTWIERSRANWYEWCQRGPGPPLGVIGCCVLTYSEFLRSHPLPSSLVEDQEWGKMLIRNHVGVYQVKGADCTTDEPTGWRPLSRQLVRWAYGAIDGDRTDSSPKIAIPYLTYLVFAGIIIGLVANPRIAYFLLVDILPYYVIVFAIGFAIAFRGTDKRGSGIRYHFLDLLTWLYAAGRFCIRQEPDWD